MRQPKVGRITRSPGLVPMMMAIDSSISVWPADVRMPPVASVPTAKPQPRPMRMSSLMSVDVHHATGNLGDARCREFRHRALQGDLGFALGHDRWGADFDLRLAIEVD